MAKCKYPNEVCANMTMLNSVAYCDSVPCSLRDEIPKQTNADRIRSMSDDELAKIIDKLTDKLCRGIITCSDCYYHDAEKNECKIRYSKIKEWLKKEVEDE